MLVYLTGCTDSAAPVPDFFGLWVRNPCEFEVPPSGPTNTAYDLID